MPRSPDRFRSVGEILPRVLGPRGLLPQLAVARIQREWADIVGDAAAISRPRRLQQGTLVVGVASPAWMTELTFAKRAWLQQLRARYPDVDIRDIAFLLGLGPAER